MKIFNQLAPNERGTKMLMPLIEKIKKDGKGRDQIV
jgi:hypothetical protein